MQGEVQDFSTLSSKVEPENWIPDQTNHDDEHTISTLVSVALASHKPQTHPQFHLRSKVLLQSQSMFYQ